MPLAISPLSMKSTITFALLFCSSTVLAQLAPSIESDGDDIVLRASGGDVKFVTQTGGTTSLQELIDIIQKLKQQVAEVAEGDNSTVNVDTAMLEVSCMLLFFFFWGRRIYRLRSFSCILFPRSPCTFPDCAQERDSSASSIIYINRLTTPLSHRHFECTNQIRRVQSELQDSIDAAANNAAQTTAEARATLNSRVDTLVEDMTLSKSAMDGECLCRRVFFC